jgi:hypothetical protein
MDATSAPSRATNHPYRVRTELVTAYRSLDHAAAVLGAGDGIAHDGDRADALRQLRAAQELIAGVGLRVRKEGEL